MNSINWSILEGIRSTNFKQGLEQVGVAPHILSNRFVNLVTLKLNDLKYGWQKQRILCLIPEIAPKTCFTNSYEHQHVYGECTLSPNKSYSEVLHGRRKGPKK